MRRHDLDPFSLVAGALFAIVGLIFLFGSIDVASVPRAWAWPIPLIIVGALIVVLAASGVRRRSTGSEDAPVEEPSADDSQG